MNSVEERAVNFIELPCRNVSYSLKDDCEIVSFKAAQAIFSPAICSKKTYIAVSGAIASTQKLKYISISEGVLKLVFKRFPSCIKRQCTTAFYSICLEQVQKIEYRTVESSQLSLEQRLWKNLEKASKEHQVSPCIASVERGSKSQIQPSKIQTFVSKGSRPYQEDSYFEYQDERETLLGVFDGHGDKGEISGDASNRFLEVFKSQFEKNPDNIKVAFENTMLILDKNYWGKKGGSTAVVTYVEHATGVAYTATLGDSESKIFRKEGERFSVVPLSRVKNWTLYSERQRYVRKTKDLESAKKVSAITSKNDCRLGRKGLNMSRSLGDHSELGLISATPTLTICQLQPGDVLAVGSDGLWDFLSDFEICEILNTSDEGQMTNFSEVLGNKILGKGLSDTDNITILSAKICST